jgi:hypothetical protein
MPSGRHCQNQLSDLRQGGKAEVRSAAMPRDGPAASRAQRWRAVAAAGSAAALNWPLLPYELAAAA